MGPLLVAAALLAAPSPSAGTCADTVTAATLGPVDAPVQVVAYLDPASRGALKTWLSLRRVIGDLEGAVGVRVLVVRKPSQLDPRERDPVEDAVRTWAMNASTEADFEAILRQVDRDGAPSIAARLGRTDQREQMQAELKVTTRGEPHRCLMRALTEQTRRLSRKHIVQQGSSTARPPLFGIETARSGERLIVNDPHLRELRPQLERALQETRSGRAFRFPGAAQNPRSLPERRESELVPGGMRVGGPGRPHELLLYADGESDPTLTSHLPVALHLRRRYPDVLSIQILARGRRPEAVELRGRLCAAEKIGLEMEYLRRLAASEPSARDLPARLDKVAERENCPTSDPETNDRGAFLDGIPVGRAEIDRLEQGLASETLRSQLRWFWLRTDFR